MTPPRSALLIAGFAGLIAATAHAQMRPAARPSAPADLGVQPGATDGVPAIDFNWYTIDGGGTMHAMGGVFEMGFTVGQPDPGVLTGGDFELSGGFWPGVVPNAFCYANCDNSTALPILNVNDYVCFQNRFAAGDSDANCDQSTTPPVLNVNDFLCFVNAYAAGCP
jgi:hypothetical protein